MNHVLQYTQLKFKLDLLMKPEILGSIPSGVANLWTLTRSTGPTRLAFKRKERNEKSWCFPVLKNPSLVRNGVVWSRHLLFIFFFKWGKLSKNTKPLMTLVWKKRSAKTRFWVRGSGYPLGRYLMRGSTPLGPKLGLY